MKGMLLRVLVVLLSISLLARGWCSSPPKFSISTLFIPNPFTDADVTSISETGIVTGSLMGEDDSEGAPTGRAFMWDGHDLIILPKTKLPKDVACAIDSSRRIAGYSDRFFNGAYMGDETLGWVWTKGAGYTFLQSLPHRPQAEAHFIGTDGDIYGIVSDSADPGADPNYSVEHACRWHDPSSSPVDLGAGTIAAASNGDLYLVQPHDFTWPNGVLGGYNQIVRVRGDRSSTVLLCQDAVVSSQGGWIAADVITSPSPAVLANLQGNPDIKVTGEVIHGSVAGKLPFSPTCVNSHGSVVGNVEVDGCGPQGNYFDRSAPYLRTITGLTVKLRFISGIGIRRTLLKANAINDAGEIAGIGEGQRGSHFIFILRPK